MDAKQGHKGGQVISFQVSNEDFYFLFATARNSAKSKSQVARQIFSNGIASMVADDQIKGERKKIFEDGKKVVQMATDTWKTAAWLNEKIESKSNPSSEIKNFEARIESLEKELSKARDEHQAELAKMRQAIVPMQAAIISGVANAIVPIVEARIEKAISETLSKAFG